MDHINDSIDINGYLKALLLIIFTV
jgi:hypothetical protein